MKNFDNYAAYGTLAIVIVALIFSLSSFIHFDFQKTKAVKADTAQAVSAHVGNSGMGSRMSRMSLTSFDVALAKEFMDKDKDGRCDACGMPVEMCISSGQLQCNMDPSSTIGVLGSQHTHADWKVYIDGKPVDFTPFAMDMSKMNVNVTSSFIHVDKGAPPPEKTGDVIHMHAKGVPLWLFFKSIGMDISSSVRLYVNEKLSPEGLNYVFNDGDKLLLTDATDEATIQTQLLSIMDYAKNH